MPTEATDYSKGSWAAAFADRAKGEIRYWLVKSEPDVFSWDDLTKAPKQTTRWDGIRNYAARNFLRDGMKKGDLVFLYHSSTNPQAIVGICEVVREGYPDETANDPSHYSYDKKSDAANPTWYAVDLRADEALARPVTLAEIKKASALGEMALIRVSRLSVVPVTKKEWAAVLSMSKKKSADD